jgi:AraC-like DNA-binding protein
MAETRTLGSGGPLSVLLKFQPRVCDVIDKVVAYQHLLGSAVQLTTERVDTIRIVHAELNGTRQQRQAIELMVGFYCRGITLILGRPWRAESVHFMHGPPADLGTHRRVLPGPIEFQSTFNGFVCSREVLEARNPTEDAELAAHVERMLKAILPTQREAAASERVRRALRLLLPTGRGTIEPVAENLGVSPRSLQRMLEREGSSFGSVLDALRRELALRYISDPSHKIGAVAGMTGFQRASSFTRWFCDAFGKPPATWRAEAMAA